MKSFSLNIKNNNDFVREISFSTGKFLNEHYFKSIPVLGSELKFLGNWALVGETIITCNNYLPLEEIEELMQKLLDSEANNLFPFEMNSLKKSVFDDESKLINREQLFRDLQNLHTIYSISLYIKKDISFQGD
jgi:hypothetical protein